MVEKGLASPDELAKALRELLSRGPAHKRKPRAKVSRRVKLGNRLHPSSS